MKQVLFISQCHHSGISKSARVLDAYAMRHGDRTWLTPITEEGLKEVRSQLRAAATRQMAVACYAMQSGTRGCQLLWVVGSSSAFGAEGVIAVNRTGKTNAVRSSFPMGLRHASLMAQSAGYLHDLGKFGVMFQNKLLRACGLLPGGKVFDGDPVRHEWLSLHLLLASIDDGVFSIDRLRATWKEYWASPVHRMHGCTVHGKDVRDFLGLKNGLKHASGALAFLVYTHHRMPGRESKKKNSNLAVPSDGTYFNDDFNSRAVLLPVTEPDATTWAACEQAIARVLALPPMEPLRWRALCLLARPALVLADQKVSSLDVRTDVKHGTAILPGTAYANTEWNGQDRKVMNQKLDFHLQNVGWTASGILHDAWTYEPPGVSESVTRSLRKTSMGRFAWQSSCADGLARDHEKEKVPTLVFNIAGTGSGKTRMNVVALATLRKNETLRFAAGFNLRTLTTQTHRAYVQELGMGSDDVALVMGSQGAKGVLAEELDSTAASVFQEDEDGNPWEEEFDAEGDGDAPPLWMQHFLKRNPMLGVVVTAPVVVATIDHLVRAGDLNEKSNHALTMMRMMKSDLVIDEVDSFDPKAMACVCKLVTAAAMWGRHVVVSSATMAPPVALAMFQSFDLGIRMGHAAEILPSTTWRQAVIDDVSLHRSHCASSEEGFQMFFKNTLENLVKELAALKRMEKMPELIDVAVKGFRPEVALRNAVSSACKTMHARHRHTIVVDGQPHTVSFGLVRIANVNTAVPLAMALCDSLPNARVACYHSQLARLHRDRLEAVLDTLLVRKTPITEWHGILLASPDFIEFVRQNQREGVHDTSFIVVATPVEEIGRDHDFDWAVIEPSSAQSIVQAAGRVNRHRRVRVTSPNVGILRFNVRHLRNVAEGKLLGPAFLMPGLELKGDGDHGLTSHPLHDLGAILDWESLGVIDQVDARLRYDSIHKLAQWDDNASTKALNEYLRDFLNNDSGRWMGKETYHALREGQEQELWTMDEHGRHYREEKLNDQSKQRGFKRRSMNNESGHEQAWLSWDFKFLVDQVKNENEDVMKAMAVQLRKLDESSKRSHVRNKSFGYFQVQS